MVVQALDATRPVGPATKPEDTDMITGPSATTSDTTSNMDAVAPGKTSEPNKLFPSAAERFTLGIKRRTSPPARTVIHSEMEPLAAQEFSQDPLSDLEH